MDSKELLEALENLKNNLAEIQSARMQVENTVSSSSELQKIVKKYVGSINDFKSVLDSWEQSIHAKSSELSNSVEAAKEALLSIGETINTQFRASTESTLHDLKEQITRLGNNVGLLDALREEIKSTTKEISVVKASLDKVSENLKKSQKDQDEVLDKIEKKVDNIPSVTKGYVDGVTEQISTLEKELKRSIEATDLKITTLDSKSDALSHSINNVLSSCKGLQRSCDTIKVCLDEANASIASSLEATAKAININRWILIAGIIVLVALHFI